MEPVKAPNLTKCYKASRSVNVSRSSQCPTKAVVSVILSGMMHIKKNLAANRKE